MSREKAIEALITVTQQLGKAVDLLAAELHSDQNGNLIADIGEWIETEEAWKHLDQASAEALRRKVRNKFFDLGHHYRKSNNNPNAAMPRYQFHIQRCKDRLAEPPRKWSKPT
ncbi:MAG: hypothetical protein WA947_20110 [Phormidesmis sp.]